MNEFKMSIVDNIIVGMWRCIKLMVLDSFNNCMLFF